MMELESKVLKQLVDRGWDNLKPADIAKSIMIEGAELLELFQWENLTLEEVRNNKEKIDGVKKELADVLIYALEMVVLLRLDTAQIVNDKLDHIDKKYPATLMRKNAKAESGSGADAEYWRIKQAYRQNGK